MPAVLLSCLALPAIFAQEIPSADRTSATPSADVERLGETLLISDPPGAKSRDASEQADLLVARAEPGDAGRHGRWHVAPHLQLRATYDDNIFIQPKKTPDFIFSCAPGIGIGFWDSEKEREKYLERQRDPTLVERTRGSFLFVDYTAILLGFARHSSQNAFDQDARFDARWERDKLTLGGSVRYESKSEANIDIGGRVRRRTLSAELTSIPKC